MSEDDYSRWHWHSAPTGAAAAIINRPFPLPFFDCLLINYCRLSISRQPAASRQPNLLPNIELLSDIVIQYRKF